MTQMLLSPPRAVLHDNEVLDGLTADEMLLDDALDDGRIAVAVPRPLRIDDARWVRLRRSAGSLFSNGGCRPFREAQLQQTPLQIVPRREAALLVAALRLGLIAAEEDVTPGHGRANAGGDFFLRCGHMTVSVRPDLRGCKSACANGAVLSLERPGSPCRDTAGLGGRRRMDAVASNGSDESAVPAREGRTLPGGDRIRRGKRWYHKNLDVRLQDSVSAGNAVVGSRNQ